MTDDLDRLTRELRDAPAPDASARARALSLAMENFDRLQDRAQDRADPARQTQDRQARAGFLRKVKDMIDRFSTRQMLAGTASAAVLTLAVVAVLPQIGAGPALLPVSLPGEADTAVAAPQAAPADAPQVNRLVTPSPNGAASDAMAEAVPAPVPQPEGTASTPGLGTGGAPNAPARSVAPAPGAADLAQASPPATATRQERTAISRLVAEPSALPSPDTEAFANADPNPVRVTAEDPVSTFSVDVDTASYAVVRQSLMAGRLPPPDAVRVEEMVNYFPYAYPAPQGDQPFASSVTVFPTPWNPDTRLVRIGLQGRLPAVAERPPLNLVFLIDTSGSMDEPAKLPLLRQSLALMLGELRPGDQVAIVAYAGSAGLVLPPVAGTDTAAITGALDRLAAGGSTAGAAGLALAYRTAEGMAGDGEVSRVLLATDGDFNLGLSSPTALADYVAEQREAGVYLSVLGFGRGNLDDAVMQALAQNGNGQAAYIDTLNEARKVLVDQLTGALFPIANDVKVQVEWNPAQVAEYRLIGYETRALARQDFNNDRVDAGEIGAGLQVTALYEITAPGSEGLRNDPLRYGAAAAAAEAPPEASPGASPGASPEADELGFLRLRWKAPGESASQLAETPILPGDSAPDDDARFAAAIAGFGQLLRGDDGVGDWSFAEAAALAEGARGDDPFGYRIEAVNLMRLAAALQPVLP